MKKLRYHLVILLIITSYTLQSQDCTPYFPMKEGAGFEITNYNPKGKVMGRAEHTILSRGESDNGLNVNVSSKIFDKKDEELTSISYEARCVDGVFEIMMSNISAESMSGAGINTTIDGDFLDFPSNPSPGQKLRNGEITIDINDMLTMTTSVSDRKVEKLEEITTPAGTFNCVKITYNVSTKMVMNIHGSGADWYAEGVGMIRSETYNKSGKMMSYSELTKLNP